MSSRADPSPSPGFWSDFVARYWTRQPVVFRGAFKDAVASPYDVFDALVRLAERFVAGDQRIDFRFNRSGAPSSEPERYLPRRDDGSTSAYARRMRETLGGDDFGIIINDFQALLPPVWDRAIAFLSGLYDEVGVPGGGAIIDLFMGDYRRTFLGLHKDSQDVFTFVVEGKKTALLWPFETLQEVGKAPKSVRHEPFVLGTFDYEPYRAQAITITAEPGDLMYWPSSYWHVIEGDGTLVTTLSLGLFLNDEPLARLATVRDDATSDDARVMPPSKVLRSIRRVLNVPALQHGLEERLLSRRTSYGFKQSPDPVDVGPLADRELVRLSEPLPLAWLEHHGGGASWSMHGRVFPVEHLGVLRVLEVLSTGEAIKVKELRRLASKAGLSERQRETLLALLACHRAIRRVE